MGRRPDSPESFAEKSELHSIGNALDGLLPAERLASYRELVSVGEGRTALENLCENLNDSQVAVSLETLGKIREACENGNLPDRYWKRLTVS